MVPMCRLAVSQKVRGSGPAVEKVRRLQSLSCTLLGSAALRFQNEGLQVWLDDAPAEGHLRVLVCSLMWDEAAQKMRARLSRAMFNTGATQGGEQRQLAAPKDVPVMMVMGALYKTPLDISTNRGCRRRFA